jgi:hypothetical protein
MMIAKAPNAIQTTALSCADVPPYARDPIPARTTIGKWAQLQRRRCAALSPSEVIE